MRYFIIGEDIPRTEITATEAAQFRPDDDYRLIVTDDGGNEIAAAVPTAAPESVPDWVPFDFGSVPEGKVLDGYEIVRYDQEGYSVLMNAVPEGAVKTDTPNRWKVPSTPGCYDLVIARPRYKAIPKQACGACIGCSRLTCFRRGKGIQCRNYRAK